MIQRINMTIYMCKDNDNAIKLIWDDDKNFEISEIQVGCFDVPSDGWSVIGIEDLTRAFKAVGYDLIPCKAGDADGE